MAEQYQQWNMGYTSPFPQYHFNGMYLPPDQSGLYRPPQVSRARGKKEIARNAFSTRNFEKS